MVVAESLRVMDDDGCQSRKKKDNVYKTSFGNYTDNVVQSFLLTMCKRERYHYLPDTRIPLK